MELRTARAALDILRATQVREPDQFAVLVSLVVKRLGVPQVSEKPDSPVLVALMNRGLLYADGTVAPDIASVLDAAYKETKEGVVLRDPIIYPTKTFFDELDQRDSKH